MSGTILKRFYQHNIENIEKALKKFKRKFEKTGIVKELRSRQQFDKPSVTKRLKKERAVYVQQLQQVED